VVNIVWIIITLSENKPSALLPVGVSYLRRFRGLAFLGTAGPFSARFSNFVERGEREEREER
jgi:hypothetical protein